MSDLAGASGRDAIAAANAAARTPSTQDAFVGGLQVFTWSPGRVFEVWTSPLRVTTLSLAPGERLVSKAAGDTVRWLLGEVETGEGEASTTHVLLKPLEQGLQTNLVLLTSRRLYLIDLRSGASDAFNAAVAWRQDPVPPGSPDNAAVLETVNRNHLSVLPQPGPYDVRYRVEPQGRRPAWAPVSVFDDGARTIITFAEEIQAAEAPVLFVLSPDGEPQMVNYRQIGALYIVDRLFDRAELRLGGRRPQVVRIRRLPGGSS
jgi:type IV secretion system protein VirB9